MKSSMAKVGAVLILIPLFLSLGSPHGLSETRTMAADKPGDHLSSTSTSGGHNIIISSSSDSGEASSTSLPGISRLLAQYYNHPRAPTITCNNFPRICRGKGSPGPDCCKKQCVNVMTDGRNCGWCGNKCRYGESCCRGNCINIMYDRRNCGGCRKRCKRGSYCAYGMCSYA